MKEVMTPLENVFMLSADEKLSFEIIAKIFKTGYSRIPVYEVDMNNIIGLLFTKDLIFIDPEDETPIRSFVQIFGEYILCGPLAMVCFRFVFVVSPGSSPRLHHSPMGRVSGRRAGPESLACRNKRVAGQTTGGPPSTHCTGHTHPDSVLFITATTYFWNIIVRFLP